jgi:hypothetical protein
MNRPEGNLAELIQSLRVPSPSTQNREPPDARRSTRVAYQSAEHLAEHPIWVTISPCKAERFPQAPVRYIVAYGINEREGLEIAVR